MNATMTLEWGDKKLVCNVCRWEIAYGKDGFIRVVGYPATFPDPEVTDDKCDVTEAVKQETWRDQAPLL